MNYKHGMKGTKTYKTWENIKTRCFNPFSTRYYRYGGRGITVCDRWLNFENFYADMGDCPEGMTLDRIDNDGNYEPANCRWVSNQEQQLNKSIKGNGFYWRGDIKKYRVLICRNNEQYSFGQYKTESEAQYWADVGREALDAYFAVKPLLEEP